MKKIVMLAISAILVANVYAQEQKKECNGGKQFSKEERVEFDIKRLTNELMLSDEQAAKFAVTYREYAAKVDEIFEKGAPKEKFKSGKELTDAELDKLAKARFEGFKDLANLQSKYYDKFRKDLSARQVGKVLRLDASCCGHKPCGDKPCCEKREFQKGPQQFEKGGPRHFEKQGPRKADFER